MKLDEIVTWYQKKIGTYDKQEWEKTIEQRILNGFTLGPLKTTKLKTEYIDVDLVRGSSFPKAKPKQRFLTVIRLAILRYLLLPLYAKWWVAQTSPRIFSFLLLLYLLQMFNWAVYSYNVHQIDGDTEHMVALSEFLIPIALGLLLSITHSQIVATSSNSNSTDKQKRVRQPKRRKRERPKRRKKNTTRQRPTCDIKLIDISNNNNNSDTDVINTISMNKNINKFNNNTILNNINNTGNDHDHDHDDDDDDDDEKSLYSTLNDLEIVSNTNDNSDVNHLRGKRNVNWHSPIKSQLCYAPNDDYKRIANNGNFIDNKYDKNIDVIENLVKEFLHEIMDKVDESLKIDLIPNHDNNDDVNINANDNENNINNNNNNRNEEQNDNNVNHIEDDGFESLNGKSSSGGEDNHMVNVEEQQQQQQQQQQPPESQQKLVHKTIDENPKSLSRASIQNLNVLDENTNKLLLPTEFMGGGCSVQEKYPNFTKWVKDTIENTGIDKKDSDSDTDTLKGNDLSSKLKRQQRYNGGNNNDIRSLDGNRCDTDLNTSCTEESLMMPNESSQHHHVHHSTPNTNSNQTAFKNTINTINPTKIFSSDTDEEGDDGETPSVFGTSHFTEGTTSATEWIGITTNSEECSYSSEIDNSDSQFELSENGGIEYDITPSVILNPSCGANDRISCTIWYERDVKKAEMSVLDISSAIIERIEAMPDNFEYLYIGICFSVILSFVPAFCRLFESATNLSNSTEITFMDISTILIEKCSISSYILVQYAFGTKPWETTVLFIGFFLRICLTFLFFFLLTVAERTFKQRFLYAKLFSHLTSSRRARKSAVPHFRLNKVRNIKTWLSVRSYLKRRGPQRSVDVIVSAAFLLTLLLLSFLSVEWLKDSVHLNSQCHLEALTWSCALGCFLLRFMTLGTKINRKYRSISVLITEQINLYLQIEQKPHKKEELMVSNSVLKLAADLLKELESPFKIYGLCANPYLYTTVKVVILSALSGVLSEMLGFKLKLHKIKIK